MALTVEWKYRVEKWRKLIPQLWFTPVAEAPLSAFFTFDQLTADAAARRQFAPLAVGAAWGEKWQYAWLKGKVKIPAACAGKRVALRLGVDGECVIHLDGRAAGHRDWAHPLLTLARKAKGGETFDLLAEAYAGHGATPCGDGPIPFDRPGMPPCPPTQRVLGPTEVGVFREELYQAWIDFDTLIRLRDELDADSLRVAEIDQGLMDFTVAVDVEAPVDELERMAATGRAVLKPLLAAKNGSTAPVMHAFGHSHIDVAWLWPLRETESKCARTFAAQLALMDEYPEYKYLQSQPHLYWMVKNHYPDLYKRILAKIKTGQWIAEGGMWVEADTNVTGGESLVRQFLAGQRFYEKELGRRCELMWLPDVFGYSGAMPQIMEGCGIKYFSTQKIYWAYNGGDKFPYVTFWWEGIDGTRVLSHFHNDYNAQTTPTALITRWKERPQKMGLRHRLFPFGYGDGGGGPTRDHLEYLRRVKDLEGCPRTFIDHPLDMLRAEARHPAELPVYAGELYFQCHRGTFTSQARTKRGNRKSEFALREAELWAVAALAARGAKYPAARFEELWRAVLLNQFHDIIPGSSIGRVYEEAEKAYAEVLAGAGDVTGQAVGALAKKAAGALSVFNPLAWPRLAVVPLPKGAPAALAADREGAGAPPTQKLSDGTLVAGVGLPSMGVVTYRAARADGEAGTVEDGFAASAKAAGRGAVIENHLLRARVNALGEVTSLFDKEHGRELAAAPLNAFHLWKDVPRAFDAWDIDSTYMACPVALDGKATVKVLDAGPLAARVEVTRMVNKSRLSQVLALDYGSRTLRFETRLDWRERHKLLKVNFPFAIHAHEALHEIQYGHLARPNHFNRQFDRDRFEVACQKWSALVEDNRGCAVLNDCKYGVNVQGNSINLTLMKAPIQPDADADQGEQVFTYAVYAWDGPFHAVGPVRAAYELNAPPHVAVDAAVAPFSLLSVMAGADASGADDPGSVVVDAVKAAEDGSGDVVVRLYESARRAVNGATLRLGFPATTWRETNMLEEGGKAAAVKNGQVKLSLRPFEIKTLRFTR